MIIVFKKGDYIKIRFYTKRFYINVLYGGHKKVIKRLMYFSPPTKCFMKIFFLTSFTQYRLREAVQSQQFKFPVILLVFFYCCFGQKKLLMKLRGIIDKKVRKRDHKKTNKQKNGIIPLQYNHNFKIRLRNHIK